MATGTTHTGRETSKQQLVRISGNSMLPTLVPGDLLVVERGRRARLGDIVLVDRGWFLQAHRVISRLPERQMGDAEDRAERLPVDRILGVAVARQRDDATEVLRPERGRALRSLARDARNRLTRTKRTQPVRAAQ